MLRKFVLPLMAAAILIPVPAHAHLESSIPERQEHLVGRATDRLGAKYCWGGTRRCFDCSGLTLRVFYDHGARLPHSTVRQWRARHREGWTTIELRENLRPGDLVFFKNTYKEGISHVGVFIGDGTFIHAGDRVEKGTFDTRYWRRHFAAAVRPRTLRS